MAHLVPTLRVGTRSSPLCGVPPTPALYVLGRHLYPTPTMHSFALSTRYSVPCTPTSLTSPAHFSTIRRCRPVSRPSCVTTLTASTRSLWLLRSLRFLLLFFPHFPSPLSVPLCLRARFALFVFFVAIRRLPKWTRLVHSIFPLPKNFRHAPLSKLPAAPPLAPPFSRPSSFPPKNPQTTSLTQLCLFALIRVLVLHSLTSEI